MKEIRITPEEEAEFIGQLIDVFEDFLESKGISIENDERFEYEEIASIIGWNSEEDTDIIFGSDYNIIADGICDIISAWSENHQ